MNTIIIQQMKRSKVAFSIVFFLANCISAFAQNHWATEVVAHKFGDSQTAGQGEEFFPANVLGPVSAGAGPEAPAANPADVVSLGKGGFITLKFAGDILDGPGPDFTVFENAFYFAGDFIFDEWLIVEVSADGVEWRTFPYDTVTGEGFAGKTPTAAFGADYLNPAESGGDSFDLSDIGMARAAYVRLRDATHFQSPDRLSAELDAVVAIHLEETTSVIENMATSTPQLTVRCLDDHIEMESGPFETMAQIKTLTGKTVALPALQPGAEWRSRTLATGVYVLLWRERNRTFARKILVN